MADCTYSARRRKAALGIDCCFLNGGFADFPGTHTPGQKRTLAVTSEFLAGRGIERLVFGDQVARGNFRTRLIPARCPFSRADVHGAALLRNLPVGLRLRKQLGDSVEKLGFLDCCDALRKSTFTIALH